MLRGVIALFVYLLMSACSESLNRASANKDAIPKDFEGVAYYGAGLSPSES
jgi:hypothetical protein